VLAGTVLLLLLVATVVTVLKLAGAFEPRITVENFERLQTGMKFPEVVKRLGQPHLVDESALPKPKGPTAWRHRVLADEFPRRFIWQDGDNVIWVDVQRGRVIQLGATLDGEQYGPDPEKNPVDAPFKKRIGGEG
jgi:hypothetical protein